MALEIINCKVVSYCEIPEELTEGNYLSENFDALVRYTIEPEGQDEISDWIVSEYPEIQRGEKILIDIDY